MSVSMVGSPVSSQTFQRPQGPGKDIRQGIDGLKKAVDSGDMTAVQSAYESLSKLQADTQGSSGTSGTASASTTSAGESKDPLSKLLSSVGDALKSGDISAVQQAFAQNGPPSGGPGGARGAGGPPPGGRPHGGGGGRGGGSSEVRDAVGSLAQSLQSGDASGAQDSLTALTKLLTAQDGDSASGSSTSATASNSFIDTLKSGLSDIGSALQAGDVSSAQKLFSGLTPRGSQGVNVLA